MCVKFVHVVACNKRVFFHFVCLFICFVLVLASLCALQIFLDQGLNLGPSSESAES